MTHNIKDVSTENRLLDELKTLRRTHAAVERQVALRIRTRGGPPIATHATTHSPVKSPAWTRPSQVLKANVTAFDPNIFGNNALARHAKVGSGGDEGISHGNISGDEDYTSRQRHAITKWESDRNSQALAVMRENIESLFAGDGKGDFPIVPNPSRVTRHPPPPSESENLSSRLSVLSSGHREHVARKMRVHEPVPEKERVRQRGKVF